jgi:hypothetical protein
MSDMKKICCSLLLAFLPFAAVWSQRAVSCQALMKFVESRCILHSVHYGSSLGSAWLEEIRLYHLEDELYVVARVREYEFESNTVKVMYCNVPQSNWNNFLFGREWDSESAGVRFNFYIAPHECSCY